MPFGAHAITFELTSERFDHASELPADANAGNRFYGRDVAEFVADGLRRPGFETSFIGEDWGWQAHAGRPDGSVLEISIAHNPEEDPAREDEWALLVRCLRKEKAFGFLSRFREVEVDPRAVSALEEVFRDAGIALRRQPD